jgi:hypothetical protein
MGTTLRDTTAVCLLQCEEGGGIYTSAVSSLLYLYGESNMILICQVLLLCVKPNFSSFRNATAMIIVH